MDGYPLAEPGITQIVERMTWQLLAQVERLRELQVRSTIAELARRCEQITDAEAVDARDS